MRDAVRTQQRAVLEDNAIHLGLVESGVEALLVVLYIRCVPCYLTYGFSLYFF